MDALVNACLERARPLAERKRIAITLMPIGQDLQLTGDRELMEYACYNLLTNAVKYSPQQTEVTASAWKEDGAVRIAGDTYYVPGLTNSGYVGGLVIDTGPEAAVYDGCEIDRLAITHGHADHMGDALTIASLMRRFPRSGQ